MVTNTLKITRATMLLSATSNGVGVNVRLVGYGLSVSRYQGIYSANRQSGDGLVTDKGGFVGHHMVGVSATASRPVVVGRTTGERESNLWRCCRADDSQGGFRVEGEGGKAEDGEMTLT